MPGTHRSRPHVSVSIQPLTTSDPQPQAAAPTGYGRWQEHLGGRLLLQCTTNQASIAKQLVADQPHSGLVLVGSGAPEAAGALHQQGLDQPILCDAERYKGNNRRPAQADFDSRWIVRQRHLGGPVLTDSGYIGEGDLQGLRSILSRAVRLGDDVIACLPLHLSWLKDHDKRIVLVDQIVEHGIPVALVLEHSGDPLGVQGALRGLLRLLTIKIPVLLLRSDVSAVGALCFGALSGAVGTTSALRHLYPTRPNSFGRAGEVSVLVPHCLSYVGVDKVASAVQLARDQAHLWRCECDTCHGRELDYFNNIPEISEKENLAFCHSFWHLLSMKEKLFRLVPAERRTSWIEECSSAGFYHEEIGSPVSGLLYRDWKIPKFLEAWRIVGAEAQQWDVFNQETRRQ